MPHSVDGGPMCVVVDFDCEGTSYSIFPHLVVESTSLSEDLEDETGIAAS